MSLGHQLLVLGCEGIIDVLPIFVNNLVSEVLVDAEPCEPLVYELGLLHCRLLGEGRVAEVSSQQSVLLANAFESSSV